MPAERFYCPEELSLGKEYSIKDQEHHHLAHVMRISEGDQIEVVNGNGILALAELKSLNKKEAVFKVINRSFIPPENVKIILAQAVPRMNRLDFILEKGTELGVSEIWLFPGQLSERKALTEQQVLRFKGQVISAMKQCGRLYLPEIKLKKTLTKWDALSDLMFFGDVDFKAPELLEYKDQINQVERVIFFIGPESGFTKEEEEYLNSWGVKGVSLHRYILRTDTAAIVALTLLSAFSRK